MTKRSKESREALRSWFLNNDPSADADKAVSRLIRYQCRLYRLYLQACNGPELTEADKREEEMLEDNIRGIVAAFGLQVEFNNDPRGNPVFVHDGSPDERRQPCNDIGGRGWAIW